MKKPIKPPAGRIVLDDHDKLAGNLFEEYIKNRNPDLLLQSEAEYLLSSNPEKEKIAKLLRGLYFREKGKQEKNHIKAKKLLLKSMELLKQVDGEEKLSKEVEIEYLKRKLLLKEKDKINIDEKIFQRSANLHKELGHDKAYNLEMSLYHLFYITKHMNRLPEPELLENAELMLKYAERGEEKEQLHKTKALYHQIKAKHSHNTGDRVKEWEGAVKEIKQTSDKFGYTNTETELLMARAMNTIDTKKRNIILKKVEGRYKRQGDKVKEDFVKKLLSPVPIKAAQVIYLADESTKKLRILEKALVNVKGKEKGPSAVFYHLGYMLERIEDVKRILMRMAINRKDLTELHIEENSLLPSKIIGGKPYPKRIQIVMRKSDSLRKQMRQDMESLLIYGNLLLDQWSYLIGHIAGYEVPEKARKEPSIYYNDFLKLFSNEKTKKELRGFWKQHKNETEIPSLEINFWRLLSLLQSKKYNGELSEFWNTHKKDIIWLNFHLRFFRNVFIEHLRKPWQRGDTMAAYGDDFNLHIPAAVGFVGPQEEKKILKEIYPLAPQRLKDMPDDYWEKKNLRRVLEVTLYFIEELEEQSDRDKVWEAWNKLGGSTPSYDTIAFRLFRYIDSSLETMTEFLKKNPKLLKLGKFN